MNSYTYCPHCATKLEEAERGGRVRAICPTGHFIHYQNPTIGVAVVVLQDNKILLGRRAVGHSYGGQWCIPCGHVEWEEDVRIAAVREFGEETGMQVVLAESVIAVHSNFHHAAQHTVGVWFRGHIIGGSLQAGDDLDQVDYFPLDRLPSPLAFPTDQLVIDQLVNDQLVNDQLVNDSRH